MTVTANRMTGADMENSILFQWFKDEGIPIDEIAEKTGYNLVYLYNMFKGHEPLNAKAKFRIMEAYPGTQELLLNGEGLAA